jgi:hypothetical protein
MNGDREISTENIAREASEWISNLANKRLGGREGKSESGRELHGLQWLSGGMAR